MEEGKFKRTTREGSIVIQLFQYPHTTLTEKSKEWTNEDKIEGYDSLERFAEDMIMLMKMQNGMGLAANQIGITKRFFAIGHETFDTFQKPAIIWNPHIINFSEEKVIDVEGCLSFKDVFVKVERPKVIEVQYETTQGKTKFAKLDGMESKCFQHEFDHLDGITFNKRVSKLRWDMANKG